MGGGDVIEGTITVGSQGDNTITMIGYLQNNFGSCTNQRINELSTSYGDAGTSTSVTIDIVIANSLNIIRLDSGLVITATSIQGAGEKSGASCPNIFFTSSDVGKTIPIRIYNIK